MGLGCPFAPLDTPLAVAVLQTVKLTQSVTELNFFCKTRVMQFYVAFMQFIHLLLALFMQVRFQSVVARLMERSSHL